MSKDKNSLQGVYVYYTEFISHSALNIWHHISFCLYINFCEGCSLKGDMPSVEAALQKGIYMTLAPEMDSEYI